MTEKIILTMEQRKLRAIDFLFDNGVCLSKVTARYEKRQAKIIKEKAVDRNVDWTQEGSYCLHVHHSKPFTTLNVEEPNGSIVELYKENGNGSSDLISAIQAGVADAPEDKTLLVVSVLEHIVNDVNNLLAIKANGWIRPKTKTEPSSSLYWRILADTIEEKKITLHAGKTKADALLVFDRRTPEGDQLIGGVNVA